MLPPEVDAETPVLGRRTAARLTFRVVHLSLQVTVSLLLPILLQVVVMYIDTIDYSTGYDDDH